MIIDSLCSALECPLRFSLPGALAEERSPYLAGSGGSPRGGRRGHDSFFRSAFGDPARLSRLLAAGAKKNPRFAEFLAAVDFRTMRAVPEGVAGEFGAGYGDLAFEARLRDGPRADLLVGFLVEHKSYRDDEVLRQLVRYWYGLMFRRGRGVPTVAVIVYNGKGGWRPGPDVEMYPEYPEYLRRVGLPFRCEFIDIGSDLCEEEIRAMDVVSMHTLLVMRYVFDAAKLRAYLPEALKLLLSLGREERATLWNRTCVYLGELLEPGQKEVYMDYQTHREVFGTPCIAEVMEMEVEERIAKACEKAREEAGDKAREEGREEGREENCRETALRMLGKRYGLSLEDIALISGLSLAEVKKLALKAK